MRDGALTGVAAAPVLPAGLDLAGGVVLPIVMHPDPALRMVSVPVGYLTAEQMHRLVRDLLVSLYACGARGLAAPSIGQPRRAFVMDLDWRGGDADPVVMLDPEIVSRSGQVLTEDEYCLSIADGPVPVPRAASVEMIWYDLDGARQRRVFEGAAARIAQHEMDHLDGRLVVDFCA